MSRKRKKRRRLGFAPRVIKCVCGKKIYIKHPAMIKKIIAHGHCKDCCLEWHLTWSGRVYSHSYHPKSEAKLPLDTETTAGVE